MAHEGKRSQALRLCLLTFLKESFGPKQIGINSQCVWAGGGIHVIGALGSGGGKEGRKRERERQRMRELFSDYIKICINKQKLK